LTAEAGRHGLFVMPGLVPGCPGLAPHTEEKRAGFGLWCAHLRTLLQQDSDTVVAMRR
jgi:hypothetical protein